LNQIEYCSGNGAWIAAKAVENPHINWIAVEKKFPRVRKIWSKIKNLNLKNLVVVCGEAHNATRRYFPHESFTAAYINFPDPWPKKRHDKNRLIQPAFVDEIYRVLQADSVFTLVTDDPVYSTLMLEEMNQHAGFKCCHPHPFYLTEMEGYGTSYFDQLWREKGKSIRYHQFLKIWKMN
jgi:tRNA (guanine-N7-)-methyltransferase